MGIFHAVQSLVVRCDFPLWMQYAVVAYAGSILALFLNFYFHAYIKSQRQKVSVFLKLLAFKHLLLEFQHLFLMLLKSLYTFTFCFIEVFFANLCALLIHLFI